jgi:putative aldouronate transport system substrate-binding protein
MSNPQKRIFRLLTVGCVALTAGVMVSAQTGNAPITFTVFQGDVNPTWNNMQDDIGKVITQKTGVSLKIEYGTGNTQEKIGLMIAAGAYPDFIIPKDQGDALIDADAVIDMTDLIEKNAPNIKKMIGNQFDRMRHSTKRPKVYFIPTVDAVGQTNFDADAFFKLQLGALKDQKYPKVRTLADYEKVISNYLKKSPTTADGKPRIGLSLLADDWRFLITVSNPAFLATGFSDDGEWAIDPKTFKATTHFNRPIEREYFRWLNGMNAKGLLDPESFTQKYDQYLAKIASGRVVGVIDANWQVESAVNSLRSAGKFDDMYGRFGAVLKSGIKAAYNQPTGFRGGWGIGISKKSKDPVRAIKFLDYLASPEAQVLINWGIEGKHFEIKNGKRDFTDAAQKLRNSDPISFQRSTGLPSGNGGGNYIGLSLRYGDGVKDSTGNYYTTKFPEQIIDNYTSSEKAALKAYGAKLWNDLLPQASAFKVKPWGAAWTISLPADSALTSYFNEQQAITRPAIARAILAKPADFDKIYDEFLNQIKTKINGKYDALMTEAVKDRLKLWGELK